MVGWWVFCLVKWWIGWLYLYRCKCIHRCRYQYMCVYMHIYIYMYMYIHTYMVGWLVGLLSLFNGISTFVRLFNAKAIILEEQQWCYLTHSWEDKGIHTFSKGIYPKVNVIAWLEFELAYYDSTVQPFHHYTMRNPPYIYISAHAYAHTYIYIYIYIYAYLGSISSLRHIWWNSMDIFLFWSIQIAVWMLKYLP